MYHILSWEVDIGWRGTNEVRWLAVFALEVLNIVIDILYSNN